MLDRLKDFIKSIWKPIVLWVVIGVGFFLLCWLVAGVSYGRNDRINEIASICVFVDVIAAVFGIPIFVVMKCISCKMRIVFSIVLLFFAVAIMSGAQAADKIIDVVSQVITCVLVGGLLCCIGIILISVCAVHWNLTGKYKAGSLLMLGEKTASEKLDEIELHNVSMRMNPCESCLFEGEGFSYHFKEVVSGYKRSSHGSSMRVMKGYSVHRSSGQSDVIRKTVKTEYPGRLFITNERIVFLAERYGFDISFDRLSNITVYKKYLEVFAGSKFYRVFTPHTAYIRDLITLMNICHEERYSGFDN